MSYPSSEDCAANYANAKSDKATFANRCVAIDWTDDTQTAKAAFFDLNIAIHVI